MDQIILKSVGSYMEGSYVGALMSNGLPDLLNVESLIGRKGESENFNHTRFIQTPIEDLDVEWIQSLSKEDKDAFTHQVLDFGIELTEEQKNSLK